MRRLSYLFVVVSIVACKKEGGVTAPKGKLEGIAKVALDHIPADTMLVAGIDWKTLRGNKYLKSGQLPGFVPDDAKAGLQMIKDSCQIDAVTAVDSFTVSVGKDMDPKNDVAVLKTSVTKDQIASCLATFGQKTNHPVAVKADGALTEYDVDGKAVAWIAWLDGNTAVLTGGSMNGDKASLEALLKPAKTVHDNKPLMDMLNNVDTTASGWVAITPPKNDTVQAVAGDLVGGWITVTGVDSFDINAGVRFGAEKDAKDIYGKLSSEMAELKKDQQAGQFVSDVKVDRSGNDVRLAAHLSEKQVDALNQLLKQIPASMLKNLPGGL